MKNNKDIIDQIKKISNIFQAGDFIHAISKSKKLLHQIPNNEFLLNIVGMSYLNLGKLDDAKNLYQKTIKQNPRVTSFKNNYANVLKSLDKFDEAEKVLSELIDANPEYINAINNLANLKKNLKKFDDAISLFTKALKIDPNNITVLYNLALCYRSVRNYDAVIKTAKKIDEIDESFTNVDKIISEIKNYKDQDANQHLSSMNKKLKELNLTSEQKIPLYFSLGKAYEDKEEYELSLKHYIKGNELRRSTINYDFDNEKNKIVLIKKIFEDLKDKKFKFESVNKKIIFICGMPRSGTTLLEQIISAHTKVESLGETEFLGKIFAMLDLNKFSFDTLLDKKKNFIYNDYEKLMQKYDLNNEFLTDKSLLNFQLIGFIKIFFPGSKVLVLKRNFENNFFSIYKNELLGPQLKWTFDKKEIKEYYKIFIEYINFWKEIFPNFLMEVDYEQLVTNTEKVTKNILEYCDLNWEKDCLNYHSKNKSAIDTASANQANKPIYKTSLNKFEVYRKFFEL